METDTIIKRLKTEHSLAYRGERWGVGIVKGKEVGMKAGPFTTEAEALDWYGEMGQRIIHFKENGDNVIKFWWHNGEWQRRFPKTIY